MVLLYEYELDSVLEEIMTRWGSPGLGAGIVKEGAIVYAKGFGVKSLETRASVQVDSTFCLASIASERGIVRPSASDVDLTVLTDPDELDLIKKLAAYPEVLQASALAFEPHRVTYYLQQLAALLHPFYNKHRILPPAGDPDADASVAVEVLTRSRTAARLVLMAAVQQVIHNGLDVLGLSAPEQM